MSHSEHVEASKEDLWQWLAETEDQLEAAVAKYNDLVDTKEKLDRREFVREILIRQLRQDVRNAKEALEKGETVVSAMGKKDRVAKAERVHLIEQIQELRRNYDLVVRRFTAQQLLLEHEKARSRHLTTRVRELVAMIEEQTRKAKENDKGAAKPEAQTVHRLADNVTEEKKLEELDGERKQLLALVNEQNDALLEWEAAYSALEKELETLKSSTTKSQSTVAEAMIKPSANTRIDETKAVAKVEAAKVGAESKSAPEAVPPKQPTDPNESGIKGLVQSVLGVLSKL